MKENRHLEVPLNRRDNFFKTAERKSLLSIMQSRKNSCPAKISLDFTNDKVSSKDLNLDKEVESLGRLYIIDPLD